MLKNQFESCQIDHALGLGPTARRAPMFLYLPTKGRLFTQRLSSCGAHQRGILTGPTKHTAHEQNDYFLFLPKKTADFSLTKSPDEAITKYQHWFSNCDRISYQLLRSRLPQNLLTQNNTHFLSCLCGSGQACTRRACFPAKLLHMAVGMVRFFAGS